MAQADKALQLSAAGGYRRVSDTGQLDVGQTISSSTGNLTITAVGTDVLLASGKNLTAVGGASAFDFSAASGLFKTTTGAVTIGPGAVAVSGAATFSAAGTGLTVSNNATVQGNLIVNGNLTVTGTTFTTESQTVLIADNHLYLNDGYTADAAQTGGLVVNYDPTTTTTTVAGAFVAGVASTSNPTVTTTGSGTFAAADLIQISGSTSNDGLYEVLTHTGTTLTVRGIGVTATVEDFTQNQFVAEAGAGSLFKVNVSVLRSGTDGVWETGKGSATPVTFSDLASGSGTLQSAYEAGNTITTSAGEGNVTIAGDQDLIVSGTVDLAFTSTGGFSWTAATGAINLQTTGAMTMKGGASAVFGDDVATWDFNGAGAVSETGMTSLAITTTGAITLTAGSASTWSTSAGALTLTSAGAATWSTAAGALTINGTAGINLQTAGATRLAVADAALTIQAGVTLATTGSGNINLPNNGSARFQIEGVTVGTTVTAANLDTLTNASNGSALHYHTNVDVDGTAGEDLLAGDLAVFDDAAGSPRVFKADANGAGELTNATGYVVTGVSSGAAVKVRVAGEIPVADARFDALPAVTDVGKRIFMSATAGNSTLTAPSTGGDTVQKVAIVTRGGTGAVKLIVQIGDGVLI